MIATAPPGLGLGCGRRVLEDFHLSVDSQHVSILFLEAGASASATTKDEQMDAVPGGQYRRRHDEEGKLGYHLCTVKLSGGFDRTNATATTNLDVRDGHDVQEEGWCG